MGATTKRPAVNNEYVSRQQFEIEKNAKNKAYAFILINGHLDEFKEFCEKLKTFGNDINPHDLCLAYLTDETDRLTAMLANEAKKKNG